jgi:hypothetical protein
MYESANNAKNGYSYAIVFSLGSQATRLFGYISVAYITMALNYSMSNDRAKNNELVRLQKEAAVT